MPLGVRYWGVGNEAWGCGGNFCPEDYAAEYRRFSTYLRDFAGTPPLLLVACGPDGNKPEWTRRFLSKLIGPDPRWNCRVHAIGAHYYCGTAGPSATEYDANQWYELLEKATAVERLILDQRAVIDEFDLPFDSAQGRGGRRIGLAIDEWGTWHFPTPGRNPAHLWQQSSLRDGLVAAITLDTFNRHADKLVMANIAQLVNVLQSLVLTEGERMLLTPTYHVFDLYQSHQGGQSVRTTIEAPDVSFVVGSERRKMPGLLGSASVRDGVLTLSVVNPHATLPAEATIEIGGASLREAELSVLTHDDLTAHNTFDEPEALAPTTSRLEAFGSGTRHVFPPASVTVMRGPLS
jgi:alpha-N-arabinofuranosidase